MFETSGSGGLPSLKQIIGSMLGRAFFMLTASCKQIGPQAIEGGRGLKMHYIGN